MEEHWLDGLLWSGEFFSVDPQCLALEDAQHNAAHHLCGRCGASKLHLAAIANTLATNGVSWQRQYDTRAP